MEASGISDSTGGRHADATCVKCGGLSRVGRGLCLSCLLQQGLDPEIQIQNQSGPTETLDTLLAEVELQPASWRLGNYEILKEIGRGGMGVIYQARQRYSGRVVAVKRLLGYHADSRDTLARFRLEAQAAASLDHPNILPIYEVSESEDSVPFFSMKLATGGSLATAAATLRKDPRASVRLMAKVARAVQYAHCKNVLHRDLKPGNILLDEHGNPLVSDFGLAKWLNATTDLTHTLTIFGTPGYIAPEQANDSADHAAPTADIYSLGAILFELLSGRPPFLGSHAVSVIRQATENDAPKLRSLCDVTDRDLETICARCLEREPTVRYQSAEELAEDLEHWLEGRPIVARPVSPPTRAWRWSKRNPSLALSFGAIALVGAFGLAALTVSSRLSSIVRRSELERHSVVIVPFEDLDEMSSASDAAQSVTRAFTTTLGGAKGILASPASFLQSGKDQDPSTTEQWKRIGETGGARTILSGTVRQRDGKQHLVLHLIETTTGAPIKTWFLEKTSDADLAQNALPEIIRLLDGPVSGNKTQAGDTENALARSYYDRGKEFFFRYNLRDQERAIESFRKAVDYDPNYGQALAMLATACQLRSTTYPDGKWLVEAEQAATAALRIAPMLPEAHSALSGTFRARGMCREALDPAITAYELDISSARTPAKIGNLYIVLGRPDLAIRWFDKATRRDTRPVYEDNIADVWTLLGDYDKAEKSYQTAAVFRPDLPVSELGQSTVSLYRGDFENARKQYQAAMARYKDNPQPIIIAAAVEFFGRDFEEAEKLYRQALAFDRHGAMEITGCVRFLSALGFIARNNGREAEGKALLEEARLLEESDLARAPENPERLYSLSANQAASGDLDEAIKTLEKASKAGWIDFRTIELDPRFDSIRNTPAIKALLEQVKQRIQIMKQRVAATRR